MKQALEKIGLAAKAELEKISDSAELENLRVKFLGKKGELTAIMKQMATLSAEERPIIGQAANSVRSEIEEAVAKKGRRAESTCLRAQA